MCATDPEGTDFPRGFDLRRFAFELTSVGSLRVPRSEAALETYLKAVRATPRSDGKDGTHRALGNRERGRGFGLVSSFDLSKGGPQIGGLPLVFLSNP